MRWKNSHEELEAHHKMTMNGLWFGAGLLCLSEQKTENQGNILWKLNQKKECLSSPMNSSYTARLLFLHILYWVHDVVCLSWSSLNNVGIQGGYVLDRVALEHVAMTKHTWIRKYFPLDTNNTGRLKEWMWPWRWDTFLCHNPHNIHTHSKVAYVTSLIKPVLCGYHWAATEGVWC